MATYCGLSGALGTFDAQFAIVIHQQSPLALQVQNVVRVALAASFAQDRHLDRLVLSGLAVEAVLVTDAVNLLLEKIYLLVQLVDLACNGRSFLVIRQGRFADAGQTTLATEDLAQLRMDQFGLALARFSRGT